MMLSNIRSCIPKNKEFNFIPNTLADEFRLLITNAVLSLDDSYGY